MLRRPSFWIIVSVLCFVAAVWFWRLGDEWAARQKAAPGQQSTNQPLPANSSTQATPHSRAESIRLLSAAGTLNEPAPAPVTPEAAQSNLAARVAWRVSNTTSTVDQLSHNPRAILLENALVDTAKGTALDIPAHLRSETDPGAYIVQARKPLDRDFRALLQQAGATIVSYIPNNSYLVRASAAVAGNLAGDPLTQTVLPYEPYFKIKRSLLGLATQQQPLPGQVDLNLLLFADARDTTLQELQKLGANVMSEDSSPFGPVVKVRPQRDSLAGLAGLAGVQAIEPVRARVTANDRTRTLIGVTTDSQTLSNYLDLTGSNVLVAVIDTGIDATHPDLQTPAIKVTGDSTNVLVDTVGHGTHVAGIIAGTGDQSLTVTNAQGSVMPATNFQFRGMAPAAKLFAADFHLADGYLQELTGKTNFFISNNSWLFRSAQEYDLAAASYDAAVRDSLPQVTGSRPTLYVFPAGNAGGGSSDGTGGQSDSVSSPGTAKNVITVGALEQNRGITNEVWRRIETGATNTFETNQVWLPLTDSDDQIAAFSSRGNVGVRVEGDSGRFKPDVVAPGTFLVSTRSAQWDEVAYYNPTSHVTFTYSGIVVSNNALWFDSIFVPGNAVQLNVQVVPNLGSPSPFPDLPVFVRQSAPPTNGFDAFGLNQVSLPPDATLDPREVYWWIGVSNTTARPITFNVFTDILLTNDLGNYYEVLSNLNNSIGQGPPHYYRYESGTSQASAAVSGMLALMQEFFEQRLHISPSPALYKAMLINGSRPVGNYKLTVTNRLNYQGWGKVNLPSTLMPALSNSIASPAGPTTMLMVDQNLTNALATGDSRTWVVEIAPDAQMVPLRATLVWTDPPGNPQASIKLVNDLDLVITNLDDTSEVFYGNDIAAGNLFNLPWDTNNAPSVDVVNNVENIYLSQPFGTRYSVTVVGRHVNVNAVTAHTNDVVQDFALVISSGDGEVTNALTLTSFAAAAATTPLLTVITNVVGGANPTQTGGVLYHQHVGANTPLLGTNQLALTNMANSVLTLGMTNQWHFYAITNTQNFTNAAFATFLPPNLAVPRMGTREVFVDNAVRKEADIDLYVTTDGRLTNLFPDAVNNAYKSLSRGGTESIILSNATGGVWYIGVKAEDQQAAEYAILGIFSLYPFGNSNDRGDVLMTNWFPTFPVAIPDGSPTEPGSTNLYCFAIGPDLVRRVIVSNVITHELYGDLLGVLSHGDDYSTLNNHSTNVAVLNRVFQYDDSAQHDIPGSQPSDGPGSLNNFVAKPGGQPAIWQFMEIDNSLGHTGAVNALSVFLEKQQDLTRGITATILPGACRDDFVEVPVQATNLTVDVSILSGTGPISIQVCPVDNPVGCKTVFVTNGVGGSVTIDIYDDPPLTGGFYSVRVCNLGTGPVTVHILATITLNPFTVASSIASPGTGVSIKDDAVSYAYLTNLTDLRIFDVDVGLLINHPRISDLAVTLISPRGTRVLLFENRGAWSTNGLGSFSVTTNSLGVPLFSSTNMLAFYTNDFERAAVGRYVPGAVFQEWSVLTNFVTVLPDLRLIWQSNNILMLEDGIVTNALPTTNATTYQLSFRTTHSPYLQGMVGWWPFDGDGTDIWGGLNGILSGGGDFRPTNYLMFADGKVDRAFFGDDVRAAVMVPACPTLDVGKKRGFSIEGWINPNLLNGTNGPILAEGPVVWTNSFEGPPNGGNLGVGTYFGGGWRVDAGNIDIVRSGDFGAGANADSGTQFMDNNGNLTGTVSTNLTLVAGRQYRLSFAYARNPDSVRAGIVPQSMISVAGSAVLTLAPSMSNAWSAIGWQATSVVFTATAPLSRLELRSLSAGGSSVLYDSFSLNEEVAVGIARPLAEWSNLTNSGVQFWYGGLPQTNIAGALCANIWDTNGLPHTIISANNAITNGGWQHVALTYDAYTSIGRIYTNGQMAAERVFPAFVPQTTGDLYFGLHPALDATNIVAYRGGLDEFSLFERPLTDCEVLAIFTSGAGGKYGTNVLWCPITNAVSIVTTLGSNYFEFVNGLTWRTNGLVWETNTINFTNPLLSVTNGGAGTNLTALYLKPLTPNIAVDDFILSALVTNFFDGFMHFTEDTNIARVPIKFAPSPYTITNFPPTLIFSNDFETAAQRVYQTGEAIVGTDNGINIGMRNWTVRQGPVTVVSNAFVGGIGTNWAALAAGSIATELPTIPGHRYQLTYSVRGPAAVGWWTGDTEPYSRRAYDLIGGNHAAFVAGASNVFYNLNPNNTEVGNTAFYFGGETNVVDGRSPKLELGDPENLRLTNSFTIEGWVRPESHTNWFAGQRGQIFFRGDSRNCFDPYWLGLSQDTASGFNLMFHIEDSSGDCGVIFRSLGEPVPANEWHHIAAVFEANFQWTNNAPWPTNELRLFVDGVRLSPVDTAFTGVFPFRDLDPSFSPGISIGGRSRYDYAEPYRGYLDELTVYGRALTDAELHAIAAAQRNGKADLSMPPSQSLAKVRVLLNDVQMDIGNGDNARWTQRTVTFTADRTNTVVSLESLLPGTLVDGIALTELPAELHYLPESSLDSLVGESAYGVWTLEIVDTRAGATNNNPELVQWQLDFRLLPSNPPPVIYLSHGITYTNTLAAYGAQNFIVPVPQWATNATNVLIFTTNRAGANPPVTVYFDSNYFPIPTGLPLIGPATAGTVVLSTNTTAPRCITNGQPYYLTVTNPSPTATTFALGVWFDIQDLTNCLPMTNFVGPAGIPRYFQFDVPTNDLPPGVVPQEVAFWLTGAQSNVTVVLSQHLPLPDLAHYDYISRQPDTNSEIVMVVTNTTPFALQTNRWYVGVFNTAPTNVPFTIQACYSTQYPILVPLTNGVPFVADFLSPFVAPPGPPRWFFYEFNVTNYEDAILFELYNMSGDADLTLQRDVPSSLAPYYDGSFQLGRTPEQIVLRTSFDTPDLRGKWYLGIYNNEATNVAYTVRAVTPANGMLVSVLPIVMTIDPAAIGRQPVIRWNAVVGEAYVLERTDTLVPPNWRLVLPPIIATTPTPAVEVPVSAGTGSGYYRLRQVPRGAILAAPLMIRLWTNNEVRISWPALFTGYTLQYRDSVLSGPWSNVNLPATAEGNEWVVYDIIGTRPRFYRLIP